MPTLVDMLKAGVHFGHQKAKWHPKMRDYIYTIRNGIHILDLEKTVKQLEIALTYISKVSANGGTVLLVSLKKQADEVVKQAAVRTNMPYITGRWLGGVFTNFGVISKLIRRLDIVENEKNTGAWLKYSKKEQLERERDFDKLNLNVAGIRNLTKLPDAIFLIGTREAKNALREARKVNVPIVAIVDTNTNPSLVDYVIPSNDDALQPINMIVNLVAEAILDGKQTALEALTKPAV